MKSQLFVMLLTALFMGNICANAQGSGTPLKGDVNADGVVNVADIVEILNIIMGKNEEQTAESGTYRINGVEYPIPEAIDLGLPSGTKWASMNIGANTPYDYGFYFQFGSIKPNECGTSNTDYQDKSHFNIVEMYDEEFGSWEEYEIKPEYDAANVYTNGLYEMPTYEQLRELETQCTISF